MQYTETGPRDAETQANIDYAEGRITADERRDRVAKARAEQAEADDALVAEGRQLAAEVAGYARRTATGCETCGRPDGWTHLTERHNAKDLADAAARLVYTGPSADTDAEVLDLATAEVLDGREWPDQTCRHGHYSCAAFAGGACVAEAIAKVYGRRMAEAQAPSDHVAEYYR